MNNKNIFDAKDYIKGEKIGKGKFSKVYLFTKRSDGTKYAAKIIKVNEELSEENQKFLIRETMIHQRVSHPAIVKLYGCNFKSLDDLANCKPIILTEYLKNGSLGSVLAKERENESDKNWNSTKKFICLLGISDAMRYLHKNKILHRDLKPDNILMDENYYPHISDFGLSRLFEDSLSNISMTNRLGTPMYMAPELYDTNAHYNHGVDVYSFGFIAYEIVSGMSPYSSSINIIQLWMKVFNHERPQFTDEMTDPMKSLLSRCWNQDPLDRPNFNEIFDELYKSISSKTPYIKGEIDFDEVKKYIDILNGQKNKENVKNENQKTSGILDHSKSENRKLSKSSKKVTISSLRKKLQQSTRNIEYCDSVQDINQPKRCNTLPVKIIEEEIPIKIKEEEVDDDDDKKDQSYPSLIDESSSRTESNIYDSDTTNEENDINSNTHQNKDDGIIHMANSAMLNELMDISIDDPYIKSVNGNLLHYACKSGNIDLFLLILSLDKFDITSRTIFNLFKFYRI